MAMQSAGPGVKRVKQTAPHIHEEAPPGAKEEDDEESLDRISRLPDDILGEIVSLLPTKEGARTQTLASRWSHLWRTAPLNLDCRDLPADDDGILLGAFLSAHEGPVHRLCLPSRHLRDRAAAVDGWLRSPTLDNLQALEFYLDTPVRYGSFMHSPPASIFRFSSTLRAATIAQCHIPDNAVEMLRFPQLQKLELVEAKISEGSLASLITSGCPALESLLLKTCGSFHIRGLRINSPTLKFIGVFSMFVELIIEDAPSLERLLHIILHVKMRLTVTSAPKLEMLGYISEYADSKMTFGSTSIQDLRIDSLTTVVRTIKTLAIHSNFNLHMVIDLMRCFPCLENLYMKIPKSTAGVANSWRRKHRDFLTSHDIRLKTIFLGYYQGIRAHVDFVTFFVLNAKALESIRLEVGSRDYNERYFAEQHSVLQMEKRDSRGARLCFKTPCDYDAPHVMHVGDLDSPDPFACGC
ncbi:putative FBD-associated F-box protein At5g56440 [Aegilops tauschii subsp. strangulata]|uniref:putative FBD-associated F-box protein At5g56440 n=1 Tax=Aegilops tauschii subsp. strangulata TaxID=200361 RepID=UPI001ABCA2BB|nr:putative FBD-associated F-box protein At5g56440 [Aegilops tauschii subsp. strangulata]